MSPAQVSSLPDSETMHSFLSSHHYQLHQVLVPNHTLKKQPKPPRLASFPFTTEMEF